MNGLLWYRWLHCIALGIHFEPRFFIPAIDSAFLNRVFAAIWPELSQMTRFVPFIGALPISHLGYRDNA